MTSKRTTKDRKIQIGGRLTNENYVGWGGVVTSTWAGVVLEFVGSRADELNAVSGLGSQCEN
jgi:hypothetical protein